jgi:hypothetical protein
MSILHILANSGVRYALVLFYGNEQTAPSENILRLLKVSFFYSHKVPLTNNSLSIYNIHPNK